MAMDTSRLPRRVAGALLFCFVAVAVAAVLLVERLPVAAQIFWLAEPLLLGAGLMALGAAFRRPVAVYACILLGSLCLAFACAELYTRVVPSLSNPGNRDDSAHSRYLKSGEAEGRFHFLPDELLGYVHPAGGRLAHRKLHGDELVFDTLCTLDGAGRRVTPARPDAARAVLLFGDSFTFGDGVEDGETFAWRLGEALGPDWQVFNYGVSGYGAHQALALIESGRIPFAALRGRYREIFAFFLSIGDPPRRACTGFSHGPRYVSAGTDARDARRVRHAGALPATRGDVTARLLSGSTFFESIYPRLVATRATALHLDILETCARDLAVWHIPFTVLLWPDCEQLLPALRERRVDAVSLAPRFPTPGSAWTGTPSQWRVSPWDRHPNARAHAIIAQALEELLRRPAAQ